MALKITDQNYAEYKADAKPLVIDFWATWCGPCQMVGPVIEELAQEFDGRVNIGKCDVDANNQLPAAFGIRNIPTILFIKNGEVVNKVVGAQGKAALKKAIEELL